MSNLTVLTQTRLPCWPHAAAWSTQAGTPTSLLLLPRRQRLQAEAWLPPCALVATHGRLKVERAGLSGELLAGQAMLLEASAEGTAVETDAHGQAVWIGLRDAVPNPRALVSMSVNHLPSMLVDLLPSLAHAEHRPFTTLSNNIELWAHHAQLSLNPLLEHCPGRSLSHRMDVLVRLQRIKALLDFPTGPVVELADLAAAAHYSLSHFQRMFTRVYGISPIDHQRCARLNRARELLSAQHLSVREVAESVGFESRSTFNRLFRERYGNSAGRLRHGASPG